MKTFKVEELSERELNTILAALRMWQAAEHFPDALQRIATDNYNVSPLDKKEIDELCEHLNIESEVVDA